MILTLSVTWMPDQKRIITTASDATVRVWDAVRYELLLTLRVPMTSADPKATSVYPVSVSGDAIT
jgi:WD40 repeat protein